MAVNRVRVEMVDREQGRLTVTGHTYVEIDVPPLWVEVAGSQARSGSPDLILEGPSVSRGRPRVSVRVRPAGSSLDADGQRVADELTQDDPSALVTSCDVWPHPVWGEGIVVQSARMDDRTTWARDCYVFQDGTDVVLFDVECALEHLLALEDQVADIVAHTRPLAGRGVR
ncbi:MAG: hypothetical protein ABI746_07755 [Dermatophilaceae bacterium]